MRSPALASFCWLAVSKPLAYLSPGQTQNLISAGGCQDEEFERQFRRGAVVALMQLIDEGWRLIVRQGGVVFFLSGLFR